jgi:hypothetical protein
VWALAAATVFTAGFRIGLNVRASNVIDVGYSGVIGANRIANGQSPYGHFPVESGKACGPTASDGEIRERIQTNGRCESANPQGDTYGPVAYETYLPGYLALGWSGKWDDLPAAHFASIAFDLLCLLGLALVGLRFGGERLAVTLAFAWVAYPFTQYAANSGTNDSLMPALLVLGFLALTSDLGRGAAVAVSGWAKFASLVVLPLWSGYPDARRFRPRAVFVAAFVVTTVVARPARDRIVIDAGTKVLTSDRMLVPEPPATFGCVYGHDDWDIVRLSEEHGVVTVPPDADVRIGDRLAVVPNHVCPTINLANYVTVAAGGRVADRWPVAARGLVQ